VRSRGRAQAAEDGLVEADVHRLAGGVALRLEPQGFRFPVRRRGFALLTPYRDLTHVSVTPRGLFLATRSQVWWLRRTAFADRTSGPERLEAAIRARVAAQPGGLAQLARFAELDGLASRRPRPRLATAVACALCLLVFVAESRDPFLETAGAFVAGLVSQGELWRILTANFLHELSTLPIHLGMNLIGLAFLGLFAERLLGSWRTAWVMGVSALGAMAGSALADYPAVVGASGIVSGLVAALVVLELGHGERLPASYRLPRRLLLPVVALETAIGALHPGIAGWAHAGGFAAGALATLGLAGPALLRRPVGARLRAGVLALGLATLLSFAFLVPLWARDPEAVARLGEHLLRSSRELPLQWNEVAWRIATETRADARGLRIAVDLAERAVDSTDRVNPDLIDTMAEARFQAGDAEGAVRDIDEAIALVERYGPLLEYPDLDYFREQRRRFTGEREPDDRPAPPQYGWPFFEAPVPLPFVPEEPSITL